MKHKQDNIADRLKTARDAKAAMLKRIAERPVADEATVRQKQQSVRLSWPLEL